MPHPYTIDYPITTPVITLGCPNCLQPITFVYEPGYPDTYWDPGVPAHWYQDDMFDHPCEWALTDDVMLSLEQQLYDSPIYRAYEYEESRV